MRLRDLIEAQLRFYHGSDRQFPVGFVLRPQPDGYVHGVAGDEFDRAIRRREKILETYRPPQMISRMEAVFLTDSPTLVDNAGGHSDYIYEVAPIGPVEKSNLGWYTEIERATEMGGRLSKARASEWALNYWHGVAGRGTDEYRCRTARILRRVT
jgi:hypothetical protein